MRLLAYVTTIPENYGIDACSERLSNYTIYLLDEDGNEIWSNHQIDMPNPNVGHEIDLTIADFVTDYRESNKKRAAEISIPSK